jgi:hypothetical protein
LPSQIYAEKDQSPEPFFHKPRNIEVSGGEGNAQQWTAYFDTAPAIAAGPSAARARLRSPTALHMAGQLHTGG